MTHEPLRLSMLHNDQRLVVAADHREIRVEHWRDGQWHHMGSFDLVYGTEVVIRRRPSDATRFDVDGGS